MPETEDYLAVIAASYRGVHESTQVIAQATVRLDATQQALAQTQRGLVRLQGFAFGLLGCCLLFIGYVVWQHLAQGHEHATLTHALTQTLQRLPKP